MTDKARESLKKIDQTLNYYTLDDNGYGLKTPVDMGYNFCRKEINTISQALDQADKLEEAMKLIVKKGVNIPYLIELIKTPSRYGALHNYNCDYDEGDFRRLTETEFNQIKEVIEKYDK